jgi:heptosyltransferase III
MIKTQFFRPFKSIKQPYLVSNILFVTLSNIGDAILTTPTLETLHQLFPNAMFDIVCDQRSAIIFNHCPYIKMILIKEKRAGWRGWLKLAIELRRQKYDVAVDLRTDGLLYGIKAKIKVNKCSHDKTKEYHSVQKHFEALKPLQNITIPNTAIWLSVKEVALAKKALRAFTDQRILAIGIGANFSGKIWPAISFAEFANQLKDHFDVVFVFGDKNDTLLAGEFIRQCEIPTVNFCNKLNILETAAHLNMANYFIGNDSGLGHIASALAVPTFTVFGVGQPHRYVPWGKQSMWYQEPSLDITKVNPETIVEMVVPSLFN